MSRNYEVRAVMQNETFDSLVRDMRSKGSKVEAGFILLGHAIGGVSFITDYLFVAQYHRTSIDSEINRRELEAKLGNMSEVERVWHVLPQYELGDYERLKRLEFAVDQPDNLRIADETLLYMSKRIVGSSHTHPDIGAFLSDRDMQGIRRILESSRKTPWAYSRLPWMELVYDPVRDGWRVLESSDGKSSRVVGLFIGNDIEINEFLKSTKMD